MRDVIYREINSQIKTLIIIKDKNNILNFKVSSVQLKKSLITISYITLFTYENTYFYCT